MKPKPIEWIFEGTCIRCTSHRLNGYGYIRLRRKFGTRIQETLARLILERRLGYTPEIARHTCDNRWCIRPDHILNGTQVDNVKDRISRGRTAYGSKLPQTRLSEIQVMEIRQSTLSNQKLAELYGVGKTTIYHVRHGESWKYVNQGPGHELPSEQPPFTYVDPDGQEFFPKPPNEKTIGISGEPDRDTGSEVEV